VVGAAAWLVLAGGAASAFPQAPVPAKPGVGVIAGRVTDSVTGKGLSFCSVRVDSTRRGATSDTRGYYVISHLEPGIYGLTVTRIDHAPVTRAGVRVTPGDTARVDFALESRAITSDPVVVTATRVEQTARMAPASVVVVDQEDIQRRAPTTFDQSLEAVSGVSAFRTTGISVQSMQIRGSSDIAGGGVGNRVLLLIDGRPALTSDTGGAFWSLVPTQFVDRVEVVKGAFSSLYGSTAMGGVVNVITRRPGAASAGKLDFKLGFFEPAPSAVRYTEDPVMQSEVTADYSGSAHVSAREFHYLVSASRKSSDGFSENTAYEFYDLFGKLIYDINAGRKLELTLGGGRAKNDYPHAWLSDAEPLEVRDAYTDDRQQKNYASADLLYWGLSGEQIRYSTRMYYYHHEQLSFFNPGDPDRLLPGNEPFGLETEILGDKVGAITQVDFRWTDRHHLVAGGDFQLDYVQSSPDTTLYGDHQINNTSVFVQDDIALASALTATVGARYDWNHLVGGRTLDQLSPKLGLVWAAAPELSVRALFGRAFRAPTIAELYLERELGGGIDLVPNPDLTAEHIDASVEAGVRWSPAAVFDVDVAVFRYDYSDLIYFEDISNELGVGYAVYQVRNLNDALMQGAETTVTSRLGLLTAAVNYTYLDARDQSPGRADDYLPYRPEHSANLALDAAFGRWLLHGDARYRSPIDEVFLYPLQAPDDFWVLNANAQFALNPHVGVSARVANLLDTAYEEVARYRMPGRNWLFGVSFRL
jgi:outer membrane cobalamin receptor